MDNAGLSFPSATSTRPGSKTPLVNTLVRRSTRLNPCAMGGVQVIKMKEPASKRRKKYMINLDAPPANADEAADPTPLNILQGWATSCGVSPMELSEDALLEGHADDMVINE